MINKDVQGSKLSTYSLFASVFISLPLLFVLQSSIFISMWHVKGVNNSSFFLVFIKGDIPQAIKFCSIRIAGFCDSNFTVRGTTNNLLVLSFHGKGSDCLYRGNDQHLGWWTKQTRNKQTRVVFKGHYGWY